MLSYCNKNKSGSNFGFYLEYIDFIKLISKNKVKANDGTHLHLRIHKPLPHTKQPVELHSVKQNQAEIEQIGYF